MDIKSIAKKIIRGEKALVFPLKVTHGWISDQLDHHILDMRGWGYIQYAIGEGVAEQIQDGIANWIVETLNKEWDSLT